MFANFEWPCEVCHSKFPDAAMFQNPIWSIITLDLQGAWATTLTSHLELNYS